MKRNKERLHKVMIIGGTPAGIVAANKLGELGVPVTLVDSEPDLDSKLAAPEWNLKSGLSMNHAHRPGLLRILRNPSIDCLLPATVTGIKHSRQGFNVSITRHPTYINPERCTLCGSCIQTCPVNVSENRKAVFAAGRRSLPGRPVIDKRKTPLCTAACPLGVNVQGYMALAGKGRYDKALELIRQNNILPGICGRICTHPCESECRRNEVDGALAIRDIKRFLADWETGTGEVVLPEAAPSNGKSVAVIGSGPAGLSAAVDLARQGCSVTILEKQTLAGGLLRYGIGPHRLPRAVLERELDYIRAHGITVKTSCSVDVENGLQDLKNEYDAILLATGAWKDRTLGIPGENLVGVWGCIDWLSRYHNGGTLPETGKNVAVIGDGNAAFDLARTLRRTGARVQIISWFPEEMIPADREELVEAKKEGIAIIDRKSVVEFTGSDGHITGIAMKPTQPGHPDNSGIAWPETLHDAPAVFMDVDQAFVAIGQTGPLMQTEHSGGIAITSHGYIGQNGYRTGRSGVYAAGDGATGPSTVVHAMAQGRAAAACILTDLLSVDGLPEHLMNRPESVDFRAVPEQLPTTYRTIGACTVPGNPTGNFNEIHQAFTVDQTEMETARCLQCGVCSECGECLDECRAGAINHADLTQNITEYAGSLIVADPDMLPHAIKGEDVIRSYGPANSATDTAAMMVRGFAAAATAVTLIQKTVRKQRGHGISFVSPDAFFDTNELRIGVFVCRCNDSLGWSSELDDTVQHLKKDNRVIHAGILESACTEAGINELIKTVRKQAVNRIVLASCVCCPLNFVCTSCTDQRSRLKHALFTATGISRSMVETCNIRGEALSLLKRNPAHALRRFKGLLQRSVRRAGNLKPFSTPIRNYNFTTAVIGQSEASLTAAATLGNAGADVILLGSDRKPLEKDPGQPNVHSFRRSSISGLNGSLGDFQISTVIDGEERIFHAGAVIIEEKVLGRIPYHHKEGLPDRNVITAMQEKNITGIPFLMPGMTSVSGLFLSDPPGVRVSSRQKGAAAAVHAMAVMPREPRQSKGYTVAADTKLCRGCGRCLVQCTYQAVTLNSNAMGGWTATVDESLCKGCGNCISVCPTNAMDSPYRNQTFLEKGIREILM